MCGLLRQILVFPTKKSKMLHAGMFDFQIHRDFAISITSLKPDSESEALQNSGDSLPKIDQE